MPKASRSKRQPLRRASSTRPRKRSATIPAVPPPADPLCAAEASASASSPIPAWVRTDWSETSFAIPVFQGKLAAHKQLQWAAKNATVAIHDAFAPSGSWDSIADKEYAVYLAICDVVLQRYVGDV